MSRGLVVVLSVLLILVAVWLFRREDTPPPPRETATAGAPPLEPQRQRPLERAPDGGAPAAGMQGQAPRPPKLDAVPLARPPAGPKAAVDNRDELEKTIFDATEAPDPADRAAAISELAGGDMDIVLPVVRAAAKDTAPEVKMAVLEALSQMGEAVPLDLLTQYADDADPEVRLEVLSIVEQLSEEDSVPSLVEPILQKATRDPDDEVKDRALEIVEYLAALKGEANEE